MENSEDLSDHLLSKVLDMYAKKSLLPNFNLKMNDFFSGLFSRIIGCN